MKPLYIFAKTCVQPFIMLGYPTTCLGNKRKKILKPAILTANHYSALDAFLVAVSHPRQISFLGKSEFWERGRLLRWAVNNLDVIGVDRGKADLNAIKKTLSYLKKGKTIGIFPEGTRNKQGGDMLKISGGAAMFAIKSRVPLVPMVIWKKAKLFKRNILIVGDAIYFKEFYDERVTSETLERANAVLMREIQKVKQVLDYYVTLSGKEKREMKRLLNNFRMPFSEIYNKYRPEFRIPETKIVTEE